jgi:hypothetical protein
LYRRIIEPMHTTLAGRGPKCRVCTHPRRLEIESLLARGAGIAAIKPIMEGTFSRRALYRHRAKHMIAAGLPAARPIPFPYEGSPTERIKWLQREAEHTAALAEQQGNLSANIKALHEISRLIWLEQRLNDGAEDASVWNSYQEHLGRINRQQELRQREARARPGQDVRAFLPQPKPAAD